MKFKKYLPIIFVFMLLISIYLISALLNFSTAPYFDNVPVHTNETLNCIWKVNENSEANITWYLDGVYNRSENITCSSGVDCISSIPNNETHRYNSWNCSVYIFNSTNYNTTQSVVLNISNADPFFINLEDNYSLFEDTAYSLDIDSIDPDAPNSVDGDGIQYTSICKSNCPFTSFDIASDGKTIFTPDNNDIGNHTIQIIVLDAEPEDGITKKDVIYEVIGINDAPTLNGTENVTITEGNILSYLITGSDEENYGGPFNFTVNSSYPYDSLFASEQIHYSTSDNITINISFINSRDSQFEDNGNHTITVKICDPINATLCTIASFNLEVTTVAHYPILSYIPNQNGTQNTAFNLKFNATDLDDGDVLNFSVVPNDCTLSNPWSVTMLNTSNLNATGEIDISTLTNNHIVCRNVTITVEDSTTRTDSQIIFFNLTNINDDPQIINYSIFSTNTHSNIYYNDLTAYTSLEFNYRINATDIDNLTYAGDTLNFTTNATSCSAGSCPNFTINLDNGMINFTPNSTYIGNHSYLVFVTDLNNSIVNVTIDIEIIGNSYPYYNESLSNQIAYEDSLFTYDVNATDADDNFDVYSDNSTLVNISSSTGIISFTPICSNVGNHSIEITINDTFKAENITSFNLEIINSNDNPSIAVISSQLGIENSPYELDISLSTTDEDITCGSGEILTYTDNTTIFDIDSTSGLIDFIPQNSDIGNNSINITVTDLAGAKYSTYFDFEIRRPNNPPIMYNITAANSTDLTSWYNKSYFPNNISSILIQENTTVIFNHTTIDPEGDTLVYVWYDDGTIINRTVVLNYNFSYNTSGTKNISLSVQENISGVLSNLISFEWNITINESNRIPLLVNPIPNQTGDDEITGTIKKRNFLIGLEENRFFDPDGDNLTFNYSNTTTHIELTLEGANVSFAPQTVGVDYVIFYAKDSQSEWIPSNNVTINVTFVPENEGSGSTVDTETTTNTITRTKTKTRTEIQIIREEIEKIKEGKIFFDLIIPKQITIYKNNTVTAPIWLENNDNITLTGIDLYAISNITDYSDDVDISFTKSDFDELKPGQREETEIIITSYKTFSNYEIFVYGNVSEPEYKDKAVLYINSIEKTKGNQSVTNTKITFARDLLSSNSECLELNEFLLRSQKLIEAKDYEEAAKIIDSVIQGCKYLISKSNLRLEQPTGAIIRVDFSNLSLSDPLILIIASVVVIFSTFSAIAVFGHKKK